MSHILLSMEQFNICLALHTPLLRRLETWPQDIFPEPCWSAGSLLLRPPRESLGQWLHTSLVAIFEGRVSTFRVTLYRVKAEQAGPSMQLSSPLYHQQGGYGNSVSSLRYLMRGCPSVGPCRSFSLTTIVPAEPALEPCFTPGLKLGIGLAFLGSQGLMSKHVFPFPQAPPSSPSSRPPTVSPALSLLLIPAICHQQSIASSETLPLLPAWLPFKGNKPFPSVSPFCSPEKMRRGLWRPPCLFCSSCPRYSLGVCQWFPVPVQGKELVLMGLGLGTP